MSLSRLLGRKEAAGGPQESIALMMAEDPSNNDKVQWQSKAIEEAAHGADEIFCLQRRSSPLGASELATYRDQYETLVTACNGLGPAMLLPLGVPNAPHLTGVLVVNDLLASMAPDQPASGSSADNPRDVFGSLLLNLAIEHFTNNPDKKAAVVETCTLFTQCRYACLAFKTFLCGLRGANIGAFIHLGRSVSAAMDKKARKGLSAACKTAKLAKVQQATGAAVGVLKPTVRRSIDELRILTRALTAKNQSIPDEFVHAISTINTATGDDDRLVDVFVEHSYVLRDFHLWFFQHRVNFFLRFAQSWGLLGPAQFGRMWFDFRLLVEQNIALRLSNSRMLQQAQACTGAFKDKGFTLAYAQEQLAAEAEALSYFAPLADVEAALEGGMPGDSNSCQAHGMAGEQVDSTVHQQGVLRQQEHDSRRKADENAALTRFIAASLLSPESRDGIDMAALEAEARRYIVKQPGSSQRGGQSPGLAPQASAEEPVATAVAGVTPELGSCYL